MAVAARRPDKSWYRRFWYAERSPLDGVVDRALILGIVVLVMLVGATRLVHHGGVARLSSGGISAAATR